MSKINYAYRSLFSNGKCVCCGKIIKNKTEKVFVISPHKSNVYEMTFCKNCVLELNEILKKEEMCDNS